MPRKYIKFRLRSPEGEVYEGENLKQFAIDHGLNYPDLHHVYTGERNHHKGWRNAEEYSSAA